MNASQPQQPVNATELSVGVWIAPGDLRFIFSRASGPGGQAVNKVSTRAQLRVMVMSIQGLDEHAKAQLRKLAGRRLTIEDEILIEAQTHRSQLDNKQACVERLRDLLAQALIKPKVRRKKKPTRSMIEKRLDSKRRTAQKKGLRRSKRSSMDA